MSKAIPYLIQGKNIILVIDSKSHTISKDTHISYGKIVDALKAQDWDALRDLVEPKKAIVNFGKGHVAISTDNKVTWKGQPFHNALASRMIEMYQDGFPIDPMVRFMENLMQNPSKRSVDQVYGFLEKNKLPITEDGYFLAFKRVRSNYLDVHSGKIDNSVGQVVEMDRNGVDDNPDSHCSSGLHFCSESYLGHFGGQSDPVMILKINPADVVSIPTDYNGAKGRCCKYEVVAEVGRDVAPKDAFTSVVNGDYTKKSELAPAAAWPFPNPKAAPAPKATPVVKAASAPKAVPAASWPFPVSPAPKAAPAAKVYDLIRLHGGYIEHSGLTLAEARAKVAKNIAQKKAMLYIVDENGNEVK
jgi:hypothetical protein